MHGGRGARAFGLKVKTSISRERSHTATARWDFIVDRWPPRAVGHLPAVVLVGGLSGHGFKFAPALDRMTADMIRDGPPPPPELTLASHGAPALRAPGGS